MYVREVNLSKDKATNEEKRSTISYWLVFFAGTGVEYSLSLDNMKNDQENAQSETNSYHKNRGGNKTKLTIIHFYLGSILSAE